MMDKVEERKYQRCTRCIMDTSDPEIQFDEGGVCNHCKRYDELLDSRVFKGEEAERRLQLLVPAIKRDGKGKDFDCVIGISGGVDSTYVAYLVKKLGLRPLAIHFDNGWNSELAVDNIQKVLEKLEIDLYTYVVNWNEFRDLQLSFLYASTPDGEIPSDHAINAVMWHEASKRGIRYVITGMNFQSEGMAVPSWAYGHSDWKYIRSVHKKFGAIRLKTYPYFTFFDLFRFNMLKRMKNISILNYINYDKSEAMRLLQDDLGWRYYGGKHYESIYTRFYQSYLLPKKFNIDKRIGHFSDLIRAGQMDRETALQELKNEAYPEELQRQDKEYVIKKLNLTEQKFEEIMNLPAKSYKDYPNSAGFIHMLKRGVNYLRKKNIYTK